jgi:hypothetical protein
MWGGLARLGLGCLLPLLLLSRAGLGGSRRRGFAGLGCGCDSIVLALLFPALPGLRLLALLLSPRLDHPLALRHHPRDLGLATGAAQLLHRRPRAGTQSVRVLFFCNRVSALSPVE